MKKFFKIFIAVVVAIFLLLLVLPFFFKGQIESKVKDEINKNINAKVEFSDFSLSLIRSFPDVSVGLEGLCVVGINQFENDTLLSIANFSTTIDLMSAISGDQIEIVSVVLDRPVINAIVLADSTANWDIAKVDELPEVEEQPDSIASAEYKIQLQEFAINEAAISYSDYTMALKAGISHLNFNLSGDLTAESTDLNINSSITGINVEMDGVKYLNNSSVNIVATILADLANSVFTFKENELVLNDLALGLDGRVALLEEGYDLDVVLAAKKTDFKSLLAMVPATYLKDFETIKIEGSLALETKVKGVYIDENHLPEFSAVLKVEDGAIKYPDLPKSLNNINIDVVVTNPGKDLDATTTNINKFHFELGGNPFDANLSVITPISNATFKGGVNGVIDLGGLADAVPMDSFSLQGIIAANLTVNGTNELVEQERYDEIEANGEVKMTNFKFESSDFPQGILIETTSLTFSPKDVQLKAFKSKIGKSDFELSGKIENYLPYVLSDGVLKGSLSHHSSLIDSNEFLSDEEVPVEEEVVDSAALEVVAVPKNLDFILQSSIDKILYDKLAITNTTGKIVIKDGRVVLDGLNMNLLDGSMLMKGQYNTQSIEKPFVDFIFDAKNININKAANSFSIVDSIVPVAKKSNGFVAAKFSYESLLGKDMSPIMNSVNGEGRLTSKQIEISGAKFQDGLAKLLKNDKYKKSTVKDLDVTFLLEEGNLIVKPFTTNINGKPVTVSGRQNVDQSIDYVIKMPVDRKEIAGVASLLGSNLSSGSGDVMVGVKIKGTATNPKLSLDVSDASKQLKSEVKEEVVKEVEKAVEKVLEDPAVKKKVDDVKKKLKGLF